MQCMELWTFLWVPDIERDFLWGREMVRGKKSGIYAARHLFIGCTQLLHTQDNMLTAPLGLWLAEIHRMESNVEYCSSLGVLKVAKKYIIIYIYTRYVPHSAATVLHLEKNASANPSEADTVPPTGRSFGGEAYDISLSLSLHFYQQDPARCPKHQRKSVHSVSFLLFI